MVKRFCFSLTAPSFVVSLIGGLTLSACGGEESTGPAPPPPPPTVASVVVTPDAATLVSLGETVQLAASAQDAGGNAIPGKTFTWSSSDEGLAAVSSSGLVTAVANGSVTITATADGVNRTAAIEVDQVGTQLAFIMQPTNAYSGEPIVPPVEVAIEDALGNIVTDATDAVTLVIDANPSAATLSGTTTVNALGGLATFDDLAIEETGIGYTLEAVSSDLTGVTSDPFDIIVPLVLCTDNPGTAIATFEDANLEAAIRAALSVGAQDDLTCDLLAGLTDLTAENAGITSLVGIQNLTSLTNLRLQENSISDLSPLSGLTSLRLLVLWNNSISDISALSGLTSLTNLVLENNSISDISALSGLTSLTDLSLDNNSIGDISALSKLTSLTALMLRNTSISDISPLSGLTSLKILWLNNNSITDIGALSGLTSLGVLELAGNSITDISALSGLTSLTSWLGLSGNSISDISALSGLTNLTTLYLGHNSITDISALSGLTSLGYLELWSNSNLTDIQPLLDNTGLGAGDTVDLRVTNVSCTDVAALQAKGVTVTSDC
ncbi:MAG: leucine-rich repeat domain-containing protein [Planctomycetota bacterium]